MLPISIRQVLNFLDPTPSILALTQASYRPWRGYLPPTRVMGATELHIRSG